MVSFLIRNQTQLLYRELLCLNMLKYQSNVWKKKCPSQYKNYRFMVDNQEYFLWKQYGIKVSLTSRIELEMKIQNLGKIFHNPDENYHLKNNGQMLFTSKYVIKPIKIGQPLLSQRQSQDIIFPSTFPNGKTFCSSKVDNLYYLQNLISFLNFFE